MKQVLAIDVGSVSISFLRMDREGKVLEEAYLLHRGDPRSALATLLQGTDPDDIAGMAAPSGKSALTAQVRVYDTQVALMEALFQKEIRARSLLHVGAERFFLLEMDDAGRYLQTSHSSSCAAGTGSFLDQQAGRLKLQDTAHLSELALTNRGPIPEIAARCSVFAKTDLVHAQQRGYRLEAICDSLCKGLADNIAATLFNKSEAREPLYMSGGVALNRSVRKHLLCANPH